MCGAFFVTLGIYQSFQNISETNDLVFSAILPIRKKDIVKGKYCFVCLIELCSFVLMGIVVIVRNTFLLNSSVYRNNALMNANCFALAMVLIIFVLFNSIFITGFFKTTYKRTKPFIFYAVASFIIIGVSESLHYIKNLKFLNGFGKECLFVQILILFLAIISYVLITYFSCKKSIEKFEKIDL